MIRSAFLHGKALAAFRFAAFGVSRVGRRLSGRFSFRERLGVQRLALTIAGRLLLQNCQCRQETASPVTGKCIFIGLALPESFQEELR